MSRQAARLSFLVCWLICSGRLAAQAPAEPYQPVATMKQLMVEIIHPASNEILLVINRGGPDAEREWAEVRRSAMTLAESGNLHHAQPRACLDQRGQEAHRRRISCLPGRADKGRKSAGSVGGPARRLLHRLPQAVQAFDICPSPIASVASGLCRKLQGAKLQRTESSRS